MEHAKNENNESNKINESIENDENNENNGKKRNNKKLINIDFSVYANLRDFTNFKKKKFQAKAGITVGELLQDISRTFPKGKEFLNEIMDYSNNNENTPTLRKYYKIILNGRILFTEEALTTPITKDSVIAMFPPIGGG